MGQRFALQWVLLTLAAGCDGTDDPRRRPSPQVVDRIEALLARQPCIGQLQRWSRSYSYGADARSGALYDSIVEFDLEEAGQAGVRPGRYVTEPNSQPLNDAPIKIAWGDYDLETGVLTVGSCGPNYGASPADIERIRRYFDDLERRRTTAETR